MNDRIVGLGRKILTILLVIGMALAALPAAAQGVRGVYVVSGVPVDATAASATVAKGLALEAGRQAAFQRLIARLTLPEELQAKGGVPPMPPAALESMIASYSVADEKSSSVRYLGRLSVEFQSAQVREWLKAKGLSVIDARALPLAVFPFAPNAPEPDRIAVSQAWRSAGLENELVPLSLSTVAATQNEFPAYEAAAKAAGAGGALIASVQTSESGGRITAVTTVTKLEGGARFDLGSAQASVASPANPAARQNAIQTLMDRSVIAASDLVQLEWKRRATVRGGQVSRTPVTALYSSIEEWNSIRSALGKSTLIRDIRVETIARDNALLSISFTGGESQLRSDMAQARLSLENTAKGLIVRSAQ